MFNSSMKLTDCFSNAKRFLCFMIYGNLKLCSPLQQNFKILKEKRRGKKETKRLGMIEERKRRRGKIKMNEKEVIW